MKPKMPALTPEEERVLLRKGTEMPYTGKYCDSEEPGTYVCRACGATSASISPT